MTRLRIGALSALLHEEDYALREGVLTLRSDDGAITSVDAHVWEKPPKTTKTRKQHKSHSYGHADTRQTQLISVVSEQELGVDAHATDPAQDLLVTCTGWGWNLTDDTRGMEYRFHMQSLSRKDHPHPWAHDVEVTIPSRVLRGDEKAFRPIIRIAGGMVGVQINQGNASLTADFYFFNWRNGRTPKIITAREQYISFIFLTETLLLFAHPHGARHTRGCPSLDAWEFAGDALKFLRAFELPCLKATGLLCDMQLYADKPAAYSSHSCGIVVDMRHRAITQEGAEPEYVQTVFVVSHKRIRDRITSARQSKKKSWKKWGPDNVCIFSAYAGNLPETRDAETMQLCAVRGISVVGHAVYFCRDGVVDDNGKRVRIVRTFIAQFRDPDSMPPVVGTERDVLSWISLSESRLPAAGPGSPFRNNLVTYMACEFKQYARVVPTDSDILLGGAEGRFLFYTRSESSSGTKEWDLDLVRYGPLKQKRRTVHDILSTEQDHTKGQWLSHNEKSPHINDNSDPEDQEQPLKDLRAANVSPKSIAAPSARSLPTKPLSPRRARPPTPSTLTQPAQPSTEGQPSSAASLPSQTQQHVQLQPQSAQPLPPGLLGFLDQSMWFTQSKPAPAEEGVP